MDVEIDTDAILDSISGVAKHIDVLLGVSRFLQENLNRASIDFTSINFDRTEATAQAMQKKIDEMVEQLGVAKDFLQRLLGHLNDYFKLKF